MIVRTNTRAVAGIAAFGALLGLVWPGGAQVGDPPLGSPLPGLTSEQLEAFEDGKEDFEEVHGLEEGLGPVFNGRSCAECHNQGAVGGAGDDRALTSVTRFGKLILGQFDPMASLGGSLIQNRSIKEVDPSCPIVGEVVPKQATIRTRRISTPIFGGGLIEAIPEEQILQRADPADLDHDGVSGRPHAVWNPEEGRVEVGRFGWKAQHSSLHMFSGDAYLNELGVTSPTFPEENLPQGKQIPPAWYTGPTTDDDGEGVQKVTDFMRFLAPPPPGPTTKQVATGQQLFMKIGCASCHTPQMTTAPDHPVAALQGKTVRLYSDLLLHDMGKSLADGIVQGDASGSEFRTPPLWGVGRRAFWLHDGRAPNIHAAINLHDGEGTPAKARFKALKIWEQAALVDFLRSL